MIPEIDFQEGYESREDGVEAPARRVHREQLPQVITGGMRVYRRKDRMEKIEIFEMNRWGETVKRCVRPPTISYQLLDHKEEAVFDDPDEQSWIQKTAEKIAEFKSASRKRMFFASIARRMVNTLELPAGTFKFAMAFLKDTLDGEIDSAMVEEDDYWRFTKRYPRVACHANMDHANFLKFQTVIVQHIEMPDLTKPQKTAKEVRKEKAVEIAELRSQVELRKRAA